MKFAELPSPFASKGDRLWGATVRDRYTFVIGFVPEIGYTASWKDAHDPKPKQASVIVDGAPSYVQAERACREQEKRLRPN